MKEILNVRFPARVDAVREARAAVDEVADDMLPRSLDDLRLLVSELVTNSVRHAGLSDAATVSLRLLADGAALRVEVTDRGPGFEPRRAAPRPYQTSGWGLYLVGKIADRWGVSRDHGTTVWFEIEGARRAPSRARADT